jgi:GT2 family glycosyltransferase
MNKVFVVILNYKGHKDTEDLLESLKMINKKSFYLNVVLVDNFPQDPIKLDEKKYKELNLKIIYNKVNLGFSGGNNVGIKYSLENGADYILILNNDTYVDKNFIEELLESFSNELVGVVVPKIYFAKGFEFHDRYKKEDLGKVIWYAGGGIDWKNVLGFHRGVDEVDEGQYDLTEETELASGCCLMLKKEILEKVKGYNEDYFLYYEDADLSMRIKKLGSKIIYNPNAIIWHKNAQSSGGSGSNLQDYYISRNRMLFGLKYASLRAKIALIRESLRILVGGRKWQKIGIKDYYFNKLGKGSYTV